MAMVVPSEVTAVGKIVPKWLPLSALGVGFLTEASIVEIDHKNVIAAEMIPRVAPRGSMTVSSF